MRRRLTTTAERSTRAADMASRSSGVEASEVALLDEGALGHEVLAPGGEPEAEGEQAGPEGAAEDPGAPVLPVGGAGHAEADDAQRRG